MSIYFLKFIYFNFLRKKYKISALFKLTMRAFEQTKKNVGREKFTSSNSS